MQRKSQIFLFAIFFICLGQNVNGQIVCKTSEFPNYGFNCQQELYDPVCGCDTVTYRNPCDATQIHNVQFVIDGVCSNVNFAVDLFPIPSTSANPIRIAIETRPNTTSNISLFVYDAFGALYLQRNVNGIARFDLTLQSGTFKPGVYILIAANLQTGFVISKKFVVSSI